MKLSTYILSISFLFLSCKDDSNPIKTDAPNPYAQKEIEWPSLQKAPWPMYRHDPQLTGRTLHIGPSKGIVAGTLTADNDMASVVIDNDSTVYIHCASTNRTLSSLKYNGTEIWSKNFFQVVDTYCAPILTSLGFMYYVNPRTVAAVYYDSMTNWKTNQFNYTPMLSPGVDKDGNLYVVEYGLKTLYVLQPDGIISWQLSHQDFNSGLSTISFSPSGQRLYISGKTLCAISITNKSVEWTFPGTLQSSSPIIDNQGNIFFFISTDSINTGKSRLSTLYSLSYDGTVRWKVDGFTLKYTSGLRENEITIDWDGNIYAATDTLFSFTNAGIMRWKYGLEEGERSISGLTCDKTNTVYVLTDRKNVYAVAQNGKLQWKTTIPLQHIFGLSPSIADGKMFIPTWNVDRKVFILE